MPCCSLHLNAPILSRSIASPGLIVVSAAVLFGASLVVLARLEQEFTPTLDKKNIVMEVKRVPSTALYAKFAGRTIVVQTSEGDRRQRAAE
jgi:cobalt-zinc-cadmium resistance protein CzcA